MCIRDSSILLDENNGDKGISKIVDPVGGKGGKLFEDAKWSKGAWAKSGNVQHFFRP
jgi:hypothetical protein